MCGFELQEESRRLCVLESLVQKVVQKPVDHRGKPGWGWIFACSRVLSAPANCLDSSLCRLMFERIVHPRIGANLVNRLATNAWGENNPCKLG